MYYVVMHVYETDDVQVQAVVGSLEVQCLIKLFPLAASHSLFQSGGTCTAERLEHGKYRRALNMYWM